MARHKTLYAVRQLWLSLLLYFLLQTSGGIPMIPRFLISTARILCVGFFAWAALAQNSWGQTDLTGTWLGNDGATYYLRQVGQTVWWAGMHNGPPDGGHAFFNGLAFTNVFQGRLTGNQIIGQWADVPRGSSLQSGNLTLQVISRKTLVHSPLGRPYVEQNNKNSSFQRRATAAATRK